MPKLSTMLVGGLVVLLTFILTRHDAVQSRPVQAASPTVVQSQPVAYQRFLPISPQLPQYALDTHTGQMCKTYPTSQDPACVLLCTDLR